MTADTRLPSNAHFIRCSSSVPTEAPKTLHANVSHLWTPAELAVIGRMSRSVFASLFQAKGGHGPVGAQG